MYGEVNISMRLNEPIIICVMHSERLDYFGKNIHLFNVRLLATYHYVLDK